jgi:hypothetical protein
LSVVLAVAILAVSCTQGEEKRPPRVQGSQDPQAAVEGLCEAETLASGGLVGEARRVFQNQSHAYLHELAAQLQDRDRSLAAELLQAKQRVESSLQGGANPELVASLIGGLRAVVESSVAAVGLKNVGCFK